jgi:hypothetical protein
MRALKTLAKRRGLRCYTDIEALEIHQVPVTQIPMATHLLILSIKITNSRL